MNSRRNGPPHHGRAQTPFSGAAETPDGEATGVLTLMRTNLPYRDEEQAKSPEALRLSVLDAVTDLGAHLFQDKFRELFPDAVQQLAEVTRALRMTEIFPISEEAEAEIFAGLSQLVEDVQGDVNDSKLNRVQKRGIVQKLNDLKQALENLDSQADPDFAPALLQMTIHLSGPSKLLRPIRESLAQEVSTAYLRAVLTGLHAGGYELVVEDGQINIFDGDTPRGSLNAAEILAPQGMLEDSEIEQFLTSVTNPAIEDRSQEPAAASRT